MLSVPLSAWKNEHHIWKAQLFVYLTHIHSWIILNLAIRNSRLETRSIGDSKFGHALLCLRCKNYFSIHDTSTRECHVPIESCVTQLSAYIFIHEVVPSAIGQRSGGVRAVLMAAVEISCSVAILKDFVSNFLSVFTSYSGRHSSIQWPKVFRSYIWISVLTVIATLTKLIHAKWSVLVRKRGSAAWAMATASVHHVEAADSKDESSQQSTNSDTDEVSI